MDARQGLLPSDVVWHRNRGGDGRVCVGGNEAERMEGEVTGQAQLGAPANHAGQTVVSAASVHQTVSNTVCSHVRRRRYCLDGSQCLLANGLVNPEETAAADPLKQGPLAWREWWQCPPTPSTLVPAPSSVSHRAEPETRNGAAAGEWGGCFGS